MNDNPEQQPSPAPEIQVESPPDDPRALVKAARAKLKKAKAAVKVAKKAAVQAKKEVKALRKSLSKK